MTVSLTVFVLSLAVLAYTFAGYPMLLIVWQRLRSRPVAHAPIEPRIAVIICVHNGASIIRGKIESCLAQDYPADRLRVVIASDGSTDDTVALVRGLSDPRITLLEFAVRRGKAACLNDAVSSCEEELLIMTDARQKLGEGALRALVRNFADPTVGAASGQLVFTVDGITPFGESLDAYWRYEKLLRRTESAVHSSVGVTGALYALRRECFVPIPTDTILDDLLIPLNVVAQGRRVLFEDEAIAFDAPSTTPQLERARKTRTLAGNFQLLASHPSFLLPWRNPILLQFVSHKVARLVVPLALLTALVANMALLPSGAPIFACFLALQLGCYLLAVVGLTMPSASRLKLVRLATGFVTLNWFVVLGFREFVLNRQAHLWQTSAAASARKDARG